MRKAWLIFCLSVPLAAQSVNPNQVRPGSFQSGTYNFPASLTINGTPTGNIVTIAPTSAPPASWQLDVTTPASTLGSIFSLTTTGTSGPATLTGTVLNIPQYGAGTGTVTSFAAPSASWPTWLVPTVTNATTTPSLAVAASAIPNSALANSSTTVNGTTCTLGSTCSPTSTTINGATVPASAAALASNASSQITAASVTGTGSVVLASAPTVSGATLDGTTYFTNGATTFGTFNSTITGLQFSSTGYLEINTTSTATSGANFNSPFFELWGDYWTGSAASTDQWSFQDVLGTGTNPISTLTIAHGGTTGTSLIKAPHIVTAGTPVIGCSTGAGTSPSVCTVTGNDEAGIINITTGTAPASSSTIFTMSMSTPCTTMVYPVTQASNLNAASLTGNTHTYAAGSSTTSWSMTSNATGLAASTAYAWTYVTRCN